ncbi:alpha/beta hydrolase [Puia sp. P3]|uniref:alpha/beta hydrolase n=1 Tax=Puia sp. P3 TaxID=3423952 RepID=UPI003D6750EC
MKNVISSHMNLSRSVKEFLEHMNARGVFADSQSIDEIRGAFVSVQTPLAVDLSGVTETQRSIFPDGPEILLNIVKPMGASGALPAFLFIYGGGWVMGDYPTHKRMVRDLVLLTGFTGVVVNYTPSPEAKYPQALHEIHTAAKLDIGKWRKYSGGYREDRDSRQRGRRNDVGCGRPYGEGGRRS